MGTINFVRLPFHVFALLVFALWNTHSYAACPTDTVATMPTALPLDYVDGVGIKGRFVTYQFHSNTSTLVYLQDLGTDLRYTAGVDPSPVLVGTFPNTFPGTTLKYVTSRPNHLGWVAFLYSDNTGLVTLSACDPAWCALGHITVASASSASPWGTITNFYWLGTEIIFDWMDPSGSGTSGVLGFNVGTYRVIASQTSSTSRMRLGPVTESVFGSRVSVQSVGPAGFFAPPPILGGSVYDDTGTFRYSVALTSNDDSPGSTFFASLSHESGVRRIFTPNPIVFSNEQDPVFVTDANNFAVLPVNLLSSVPSDNISERYEQPTLYGEDPSRLTQGLASMVYPLNTFGGTRRINLYEVPWAITTPTTSPRLVRTIPIALPSAGPFDYFDFDGVTLAYTDGAGKSVLVTCGH